MKMREVEHVQGLVVCKWIMVTHSCNVKQPVHEGIKKIDD